MKAERYTTTAAEVTDTLLSMQNEAKRRIYMRFFKTGPGDYGEGDKFLGIVNPKVRSVVKQVGPMSLDEVHKLLMSEWHEVRLCGLLILVSQFERLCKPRLVADEEAIARRDEIVSFYLDHAACANNWDLVDLSVHKILGRWLMLPTRLGCTTQEASLQTDYKLRVIDALADSPSLWLKRMSMVCTWWPSNQGDASWCLRYATRHIHQTHDLMHKAVGWMLREMGKHCGMDTLRAFLDTYYASMPRTTLRYAIERMSDDERQQWLRRR